MACFAALYFRFGQSPASNTATTTVGAASRRELIIAVGHRSYALYAACIAVGHSSYDLYEAYIAVRHRSYTLDVAFIAVGHRSYALHAAFIVARSVSL